MREQKMNKFTQITINSATFGEQKLASLVFGVCAI